MARGDRGRARRGRNSHNAPGHRQEHGRGNEDLRNEGTINSSLPERFRSGFRRPSNVSETMHNNGYRVELNLGPREYMKAQTKISNDNPNDWRSLPEIPTSDEIAVNDNDAVAVPANRIRGKWKSKDKYLRSHYELLREDSIAPIREAVDKVRKDLSMMDNKDLAIYEKVHIRGFTFARGGVAARITFSTARAGCKINWQSSSRLVSGSILALTPVKDKFITKCVVAIVAARPKAGLECNPPEIDIYFSRPEDVEVDPQQEWLMVEAKKGFYESLRHTMRALQKLQSESFPLQDRICSLNANLEPPSYINPALDLNLSAAISDINKKEPLEKVNIISNWPDAPQNYLDDTQWEAVRQILTKDLSIIQGPPGTGKTFVSKIALQILVENRSANDPPIIVAAQTNHALDQLLKHVSMFDPEYIRLGGRSKDEEVKRRALFHVRQANKLPPVPSSLYGLAQKKLDRETEILRDTLDPLSPRQARNPFSAADLFSLGVISRDQGDSLVAGAREWVTSVLESNNETKIWLGKALMPWSLIYKENFGFEEAEDDLEYEQLREHEAETGQADQEDVELLRGFWCAIEQHNTVPTPPPAVLDKAKRQLDLTIDLWKIPPTLRGPVYFVMQEKAKAAMSVRFRDQIRAYDKICRDLKTGIFERDAVYLSKTNIIGLTTTGLSKYRPLIASMKPKIILIEEAAEIIEAPVTAACVESLEHLILVGDHKQLQGHCTVEELGKAPYNLNVSMFERLVSNGIPFKTLLHQRRMNPDFRELLGPIYPELQDHPDVLTRDPLHPYGMGDVRSFFLDHNWPELRDAQMSMYNDKEAEFISGFYEYLMMNKVHPSKITILTFYNGQRKRILKYIRDRPLCKQEYHNVKTVDGYQGEENEIVILSLVRNNQKNIGFLDNEHRVCVALSRAKRGFYIFGNRYSLAKNSELWSNVFSILKRQNSQRVGIALPLKCNKHGRTTFMQYPEDWSEHRGGCDLPCGEILECGHPCNFTCHSFDHSLLNCLNPCQKQLSCSHACQKKCFEPCFCDCAGPSMQGDRDSDGSGDGPNRRGVWDSRYPERFETPEMAWGNSGNDDWAAPDETTDERDWGAEAAGTNWCSSWGQPSSLDKHSHPKKAFTFRQPYKGPSQVLARLPIRSEEQQATKDDKDGKIARKSTSPTRSSGQASHSSRPSTSSSATQLSSGSSTVRNVYGNCSQHSVEKQEKRRGQWGEFTNGGVNIDDKERELKKVTNRAGRNHSDKSAAFVPDKALPGVTECTKTTRKDGKKVFNEVYQPAGCTGTADPEQMAKPTDVTSLMETSGESYKLLEPSLLD